uniref:Uncharacterized protein n=1 Tax=viral metagenome TaxID=1070528 RepID=A0A6M3L8L7_9ZZZZ
MEFKLDKTDRLIINAAAKDADSQVLHCVHISKGRIEAANGFVLVERKIDYDGDDLLLDMCDIAKHKDSKALNAVVYTSDGDNIKAIGQDINIISKCEGTFPNTEALYPKAEPVFKISLSKDRLMEVLKCLGKDEEQIKLYFYGQREPVKIETISGDVKGMIMPMTANWEEEEESEKK